MRPPLICGLNYSNEQILKQHTVNTAHRQSGFLNTPSVLKCLLHSTKGTSFRNNIGGPNLADPKAKEPSANAPHAPLPLQASCLLALVHTLTSKGVLVRCLEQQHRMWL